MIQRLIQLGFIALCCSCVDVRYARYDESQFAVAMTPAEDQVGEHLEVLEAWVSPLVMVRSGACPLG